MLNAAAAPLHQQQKAGLTDWPTDGWKTSRLEGTVFARVPFSCEIPCFDSLCRRFISSKSFRSLFSFDRLSLSSVSSSRRRTVSSIMWPEASTTSLSSWGKRHYIYRSTKKKKPQLISIFNPPADMKVMILLYLTFEHGTQLFLPDLQRANFVGKSHDCGVESLVLPLRDTTVTFWPATHLLAYFYVIV